VVAALWACAPVGDDAAPLDAGAPDGATPPVDAAPRDAGPARDVAPPADAAGPDAAPPADAAPGPPLRAPATDELPRFAFPVHPEDRGLIFVVPRFGVDHDPADGRRVVCTDFDGQGFPACYDGHEGTDFMLRGGFTTMDRGSARVVAAAGGEVIRVEDGFYDRCHGDVQTVDVTCDGHPQGANRVHLRHANGWVTEYLHLKQGSVTVAVGDVVRCGDELGRVGSSGYSSAPHLHFAVEDDAGGVVDPFAGEVTGPVSLWGLQRDADGHPGATCDRAWTRLP
jgi:murein DD-endopeptidase MepM/ murein hydrolase activator NlpD